MTSKNGFFKLTILLHRRWFPPSTSWMSIVDRCLPMSPLRPPHPWWSRPSYHWWSRSMDASLSPTNPATLTEPKPSDLALRPAWRTSMAVPLLLNPASQHHHRAPHRPDSRPDRRQRPPLHRPSPQQRCPRRRCEPWPAAGINRCTRRDGSSREAVAAPKKRRQRFSAVVLQR